MRYEIRIDAKPLRALRRIEPKTRERLRKAISGLADDPRPHGSKKLSGKRALYRIRVGRHRVVYAIRDKLLLVLVVAVGPRRDVYRGI